MTTKASSDRDEVIDNLGCTYDFQEGSLGILIKKTGIAENIKIVGRNGTTGDDEWAVSVCYAVICAHSEYVQSLFTYGWTTTKSSSADKNQLMVLDPGQFW